jgi:hypothetical protein
MANSTIAALLLVGILVCLYASCAVSSLLANVRAVMTLNGFQQGEGGGGPAACDGQFHSDDELIVSLSSEWFDGGSRCGKKILIMDYTNLYVFATVVDECSGCVNEVGASAQVWRNFNLDPSVGEASINFSDVV